MRVVVAPDSFKGTIGAADAAAALAAGWRAARPGDEVTCLPLADGGEGTVECWPRPPRTRAWHEAVVSGPGAGAGHGALAGAARPRARHRGWPARPGCRSWPCPTRWARTPPASASCSAARWTPGPAGSCSGLGGSASTDGGTGALAALGARFLDAPASGSCRAAAGRWPGWPAPTWPDCGRRPRTA